MADEADLKIDERLASHSSYFNSLVQLVPTKFYLPDNDEEKGGKFYKNKGKQAPKQSVKESSRKAKKRRLDPEQPKSALDLQDGKANKRESSDSGNDSAEEEGDNDGGFSVEKVASGKISDLRAKLHERIEMLQLKRKSSEKHTDRPKKKSKSEIKADKNKKHETSRKINEQHEKKPNRVLNDKGEVVFSKFDFMERTKEKGVTHGSKARNYKTLLAKAERRQKKLEDLAQENPSRAQELKERIAWRGALAKAEGVKQKDDPKLIKKSLKRREKQKEKSRKQWKSRIEHTQKQKEDRQKQRQKNLKERSLSKKGKGMKGKPKNPKKHKPGF
ncbi:predicted protein [Nematostella vectensis]|uniref:Surfeit 6 n=2 Tax=Nematostella vectensis TaxID=45351 RepID=A7SUQ1_NEMVE|nr:predicted protein [Nematostella vectensis]|eukprot:XP_001624648.1 predicted protein [Nematostella vectensis]